MPRGRSGDVVETLVELMELPGPTGQEESVLAWCRARWRELGADVSVAPVANVTARIGGSGPRLLIEGHADEISFVVKSIDDRGFIWLGDGQAGGSRELYTRHAAGQPGLVLGRKGDVPGLFATVSGHILGVRSDTRPLVDNNDLFFDIGAESRAEVLAAGIFPGAGVIWNPPTRRLGNRLHGKAVDDRVALALVTHLLSEVKPSELKYDLTVAALIQEEIGLTGAHAIGARQDFDLAIAIDNGPVNDYPGTDAREMSAAIGKGPVLAYKDSWVHYDRRILNRMRSIAESEGIAVQESIIPSMGTDGAALIRAGIPTALLVIPTRYTHSPFEMVDTRDVRAALALLKAFVITSPTQLEPGPR